MAPRLLLLQARRPEDPMRAQEVECFVRGVGGAGARVVAHDLLAGPPSLAEVRRHDALLIGGSGHFYVSRGDLPGFGAFLDLLREVVEAGYPTFASCFGYQAMVRALGGEVVRDPGRTEVGTYRLSLTDEGRADPLFGQMPACFAAQMGHKDCATRHPDGVPNLAASDLCPLQALRIPGKPVWATQCHPELDRATNLERFKAYLDGYSVYMSPEERASAFARFTESREASTLMRRFLRLVL